MKREKRSGAKGIVIDEACEDAFVSIKYCPTECNGVKSNNGEENKKIAYKIKVALGKLS